MKIVNRDQFMDMPAGTLFCKGKPWYFGELMIKADTLRHGEGMGDWVDLNMFWPYAMDSGEATDILDQSLEEGRSFSFNSSYGRDGCFDSDDLFMVMEQEDLLFLRANVDYALSIQKPKGETE